MAQDGKPSNFSKPWESYTFTPTEKDVFAPSPYKDRLLPLWRFRTPEIARESANDIWEVFLDYENQDDFVGMDNARKFLQMGMTRAKRYANHKGGKKFAAGETARVEAEEQAGEVGGRSKRRKLKEPPKDENWSGRQEKEEASLVFREVWEKAKSWDGYVRRKAEFLMMQKEWKRNQETESGSRNAAQTILTKKRKRKDDVGG